MSQQTDFQSYAGPGDRDLPTSEISGYQPPSRIGEIVVNAFVDAYEFADLQPALTGEQLNGRSAQDNANAAAICEYKPMFHEWATVQPGMICLARRKRQSVFRHYQAAETALPVIACAACLPVSSEKDLFFAGVARSSCIMPADDGVGPRVDEMFTLSLGGIVEILNTSAYQIMAGDLVEWCLMDATSTRPKAGKRLRSGPRRIGIRPASPVSAHMVGRAMSFAKPGERLDVLL